jgi:hypothetical protein
VPLLTPLTRVDPLQPFSEEKDEDGEDDEMVYSIPQWISDCKRQGASSSSSTTVLNGSHKVSPVIKASRSDPISLLTQTLFHFSVGLSCLSKCRSVHKTNEGSVRQCSPKNCFYRSDQF